MVGLGDCIRLLNCNEKTEIYVFGVFFVLLFLTRLGRKLVCVKFLLLSHLVQNDTVVPTIT